MALIARVHMGSGLRTHTMDRIVCAYRLLRGQDEYFLKSALICFAMVCRLATYKSSTGGVHVQRPVIHDVHPDNLKKSSEELCLRISDRNRIPVAPATLDHYCAFVLLGDGDNDSQLTVAVANQIAQQTQQVSYELIMLSHH